MTEDDARHWIAERFGTDKVERLDYFVELLKAENDRQNLIAPSTLPVVWTRHILDSAQLVPLATQDQRWLDVGTGGGFPGMVAAILHPGPVTMVEPRRRRAVFLEETVVQLGLQDIATVIARKVEQVGIVADIISARAVAQPEKLLQATRHCATAGTRWLLPRGRSDNSDIPAGMMFHVKHSITDPESSIVVMGAAE